MNKDLKEKLKGTLVIVLGLTIVLLLFSFIIGWNLGSLLLFWLIITPFLAIQLPKLISNKEKHFVESISGLIIFYGLMTLMIYDHYRTDYFKVLIFSCLINLVLTFVITWTRSIRLQTQQDNIL